MPPGGPEGRSSDDRLGSWKAIATYLGRDVSTVQRWERVEGMPVHRHVHLKRGSVYASRAELDAWRTSRGAAFGPAPPTSRASDAGHRPSPRRALLWVAVATAAVAIAIGAWLRERNEAVSQSLLLGAHFSALTDFEGTEREAAISRDGKFVAFLSDGPARSTPGWVRSERGDHNRPKALGGAAGPRIHAASPSRRTARSVTMWTRRPGDGGAAAVSTGRTDDGDSSPF
jgi:hypothetical protein